MKDYIVHDKITGEIIRTGSCPDDMVDIQKVNDNENVIEGKAHDEQDYIKDGKVAKLTKAMLTAKLSKFPQQTDEQIRQETLIRDRMDSIIRKQAIAELQDEGVIINKK